MQTFQNTCPQTHQLGKLSEPELDRLIDQQFGQHEAGRVASQSAIERSRVDVPLTDDEIEDRYSMAAELADMPEPESMAPRIPRWRWSPLNAAGDFICRNPWTFLVADVALWAAAVGLLLLAF